MSYLGGAFQEHLGTLIVSSLVSRNSRLTPRSCGWNSRGSSAQKFRRSEERLDSKTLATRYLCRQERFTWSFRVPLRASSLSSRVGAQQVHLKCVLKVSWYDSGVRTKKNPERGCDYAVREGFLSSYFREFFQKRLPLRLILKNVFPHRGS